MFIAMGIVPAAWYFSSDLEMSHGRFVSSVWFSIVLIGIMVDLVLVELVSTLLVRAMATKKLVSGVLNLLKKLKHQSRDLYMLSIYEDKAERKERERLEEEKLQEEAAKKE